MLADTTVAATRFQFPLFKTKIYLNNWGKRTLTGWVIADVGEHDYGSQRA